MSRQLARHCSTQPLSVIHVPAEARTPSQKPTKVVLIHGMWHGAWYWKPLQRLLAESGIQSFAIDQRPGSLKFKSSYLQDLTRTLDGMTDDDLDGAVVLGHSQGGILAQYLMRDYFPNRSGVSLKGTVMCGTIPLHIGRGAQEMPMLFGALQEHGLKGVFAEWSLLQSLYFCASGKLLNRDAAQRIFLLPSTTQTTVADGLDSYMDKMLHAPSDGWPTMTHVCERSPSLSFPLMEQLPMLVLAADSDKCYDAQVISPIWEQRFPHREEFVAPNQGHCFADPGWEQSMGGALVNWLQKVDSIGR